jgi:aminoglycoside phosphotransferase (APT) family kinase protein
VTDTAPVRPGEELDWAALERHLRANIPELEGDFVPLQFPSGSANLTYLLRFGDLELVLRRPPFGVVAPGAHDMKREFRVLSKLWQIFDRAPRAYLFGDDHSIIGSDFVVMERRHGEVIRGEVPPSMASHVDFGRRISFALVDAMADLHLLDPADVDLSTLGRPDGFVERQVSGWHTRWDLVRPEHGPPEMDTVPARLAETIPQPTRVSFVHNDLKLDNCQFDPADPDRVRSIFDWDMTTLGEPLVDLGTGADRDGPADTARDHSALRRPNRHRHVDSTMVRGIRAVEDGCGHPATAPAMGAW